MRGKESLVNAVRQLASELPLESHYDWEMPASLPITIPSEIESAFRRNLHLKEHLRDCLENDPELRVSFWLIQEWGGIRTFKNTGLNRQRISEFYDRLGRGKLTRILHGLLPSLSKLAAFRWPDRYSIYDSRAVYSLNWLLFCHEERPALFPQPPGRSKALVEIDMQTLFRLSGREYSVRSHKTAYHDYCSLLLDLSREALGKERPYYVEMLLFVAAREWVARDIRARTNVAILTEVP